MSVIWVECSKFRHIFFLFRHAFRDWLAFLLIIMRKHLVTTTLYETMYRYNMYQAVVFISKILGNMKEHQIGINTLGKI